MSKILSLVTLITPRGDYGGPVRVAVNQARALEAIGHSVTVVAGTAGFATVPTSIDGVRTRLFPVRTLVPKTGFAGLASPEMIAWLRANIAEFDVVHVHVARDLVTLPAALLAQRSEVPYHLQPHGMIDPSYRRSAGVIDTLLTRRVLLGARTVFYLSETERRDLQAVEPNLTTLRELPNGVPATTPIDRGIRRPGREVLYLARLAARKRPGLFVEMAAALSARHPDTHFALVGPDEGEAATVDAGIARAGAEAHISREPALAPDDTLDRMRAADIYVLPAVDEPYPMSVLEAMSVGLPVVVTDSCGLAPFVVRHRAGVVVDSSKSALIDAVDRLLEDPSAAWELGDNGLRAVRTECDMGSIASILDERYRR